MDATLVRTLLWCPDAVRADLSARVEAAWNAWCGDWGLACAGVRANDAWGHAPHDLRLAWQPLHVAGEGRAWLGAVATSPAAAVGAWLFGSAAMQQCHGTALAHEVAERACIALSEALALALPRGVGPFDDAAAGAVPPAAESAPWSGAVRLRLRLREQAAEMVLHVAPEIVKRLQPAEERRSTPRVPAAPCVRVDRAAARCPVRLRVELDDLEIDLRSLADMRAGDVVAFTHRLDEPLIVRLTPDISEEDPDASPSPPTCLAALGSRHGRRAVQLVRGTPSCP